MNLKPLPSISFSRKILHRNPNLRHLPNVLHLCVRDKNLKLTILVPRVLTRYSVFKY